jgi:hypothetical protein
LALLKKSLYAVVNVDIVECLSAQWLDTLYIIIYSKKNKPISNEHIYVIREPGGLIKVVFYISIADHVHIATGLKIIIVSAKPNQHYPIIP